MICFIGGSEPYLVDCQKRVLIGAINCPELNYMESDVLDENVFSFLKTLPIGDTRKVAYVVVNELSECNTSLFLSFKDKCPAHVTLVVKFQKFDGHSSFYKQLHKDGLVSLYDKSSAVKGLAKFVNDQAVKRGALFEAGVLAEFLRRENYENCDNVTIYTIIADLKNLIALDKRISMANVLSLIPENGKDNMYAVAKMIRKNDVKGLLKQAALLHGQEINALSALLKEYRLAYKSCFFSAKDMGVNYIVFQGMDRDVSASAINLIVDAIDALKHGGIPSSVVLQRVFLQLTQLSNEH